MAITWPRVVFSWVRVRPELGDGRAGVWTKDGALGVGKLHILVIFCLHVLVSFWFCSRQHMTFDDSGVRHVLVIYSQDVRDILAI